MPRVKKSGIHTESSEMSGPKGLHLAGLRRRRLQRTHRPAEGGLVHDRVQQDKVRIQVLVDPRVQQRSPQVARAAVALTTGCRKQHSKAEKTAKSGRNVAHWTQGIVAMVSKKMASAFPVISNRPLPWSNG